MVLVSDTLDLEISSRSECTKRKLKRRQSYPPDPDPTEERENRIDSIQGTYQRHARRESQDDSFLSKRQERDMTGRVGKHKDAKGVGRGGTQDLRQRLLRYVDANTEGETAGKFHFFQHDDRARDPSNDPVPATRKELVIRWKGRRQGESTERQRGHTPRRLGGSYKGTHVPSGAWRHDRYRDDEAHDLHKHMNGMSMDDA